MKYKTRPKINERFGKLKVTDGESYVIKNQRYWLCTCECGNTCYASTNSLNNGKTCCGCSYRIQTNKKYGNFLVICSMRTSVRFARECIK